MGKKSAAEKRVLCYGDSNTWGAIPGPEKRRHPRDARWPSVLADALGSGYTVLDEGLCGRTTAHDDTVEVGLVVDRNGMRDFGGILDTHSPLDLVVIMLGTNDLKQRYNLSVVDIALSVANLAKIAGIPDFGPDLKRPAEVLVVCPPPILEVGDYFGSMFRGGAEKSKNLPEAFRAIVEKVAPVLYAGDHVQSDPVDGIHLSPKSHDKLGKAIAKWIKAHV